MDLPHRRENLKKMTGRDILLSDDALRLVKTLFSKIHEYSGYMKVFGTLTILPILVLIDSEQKASICKELQEYDNGGSSRGE